MDTLNLVSEINNKLAALDAKIEKTSRAASVAFSYLYSHIDSSYVVTPELVSSMDVKYDDMLTKYSYMNILLSNLSDDMNSYVTTINSDLDKINSYITGINNSLSYYTTNDSVNKVLSIKGSIIDNSLSKLEKSIEDIKNEIIEIKAQVNKFETCPEKFIMIKAKRSIINRIIDWFSEFFYKMFHQKQIRLARKAAEQERLEQEEREKQAKLAAIEKEKLENEERTREEIRKKNETRSKINNLLKNK